MVALALVPVLLPVAIVALLVWAIARALRRRPDVIVMPASR
jgi:hypothetical protein